MRRERVVVISPRKSGTHMILRLLVALGYGVWGDIGAPADALPRLSIRDRLNLAKLVMAEQDSRELDARNRTAELIEKTNLAWMELAQSWSCRLGAAPIRPYQMLQSVARAGLPTRPQLWTSSFAQTPPGICWIYHSLDVSAMDDQFLREWHNTGCPAIILNRRDPRDALVSMATFLASDGFRGIRKAPEAQLYSPGFAKLAKLEDRIDAALSDQCLPLFQDYERAVSFYRHPAVCNVSFEELVGREGGGTLDAQQAAVDRVASFLGIPCDAAETAGTLFDPQAFTFHKGQVGTWRKVLSDAQQAAFSARHPGLTAALGYF